MDAELRARGSRLLVRRGEPFEVLQELVRETAAEHIFAERDVWPYGRQGDARVAQDLPLNLVDGLTLLPSGSVLKDDGQPYTVYMPYSRRWHEMLETSGGLAALPSRCLLSPERLTPVPQDTDSESLEQVFADFAGFIPNEAEANRRLEAWFKGNPAPVDNYDIKRDRLDLEELRFRFICVGVWFQCDVIWPKLSNDVKNLLKHTQQGYTWVAELVWREFFKMCSITFHA